ncbi:MAG: light-harvesting antenna LH1, beta subunit [Pseudomonadota bacterium]
MSTETSDRSESLSGLTAAEAQEFHKLFVMGFIIFTLIAAVAHFLVWMWRPWIPGPDGYSSVEGVTQLASVFTNILG